ncbi:isochorismatase family protein [Pseudonocardia sp. RS010]|uniref:isochorismatase family protein n=1 Tax=Pseudonocardia sp. RS010 TaxID=3385979 RepID=UPI0039A033C1
MRSHRLGLHGAQRVTGPEGLTMPFSTLDPKTALIVVDLQKGITGLQLAHPTEDVVARSAALVEAFRRHDLPVVLVNVAGSPPGRTDQRAGNTHNFPEGWTDLVPELNQHPDDIVITKFTRGAFSDTGLTERLRGLGVTQVVIVGISTSSGVESTARHAHEHGFHVTLPVDAMTNAALDSHEHSLSKIFPRIAETGSTDELLQLLESTRQ